MRLSARFLLVLAVLFWSGNYVIGRAVVTVIPPLTLTYLRWLETLLLFLPFCWKGLKENYRTLIGNWPYFVLLGATGIIGFNTFQYLAVKYTTAINATIINASTPMFTAAISYLVLQEKLSWKQVAGIVLSFLGVITVITRGKWLQIFTMSFNTGDLMMLVAVMVNTVYYLAVKRKGKIAPPNLLFICSVMAGLLVTFPLPLVENYLYTTAWVTRLRRAHLVSLLYFAIFPSILAMLFFNRAIMEIGPVKTSIYTNLSIVFTSILGMTFLGERLTLFHFLGGVLIVYGVWLTNETSA